MKRKGVAATVKARRRDVGWSTSSIADRSKLRAVSLEFTPNDSQRPTTRTKNEALHRCQCHCRCCLHSFRRERILRSVEHDADRRLHPVQQPLGAVRRPGRHTVHGPRQRRTTPPSRGTPLSAGMGLTHRTKSSRTPTPRSSSTTCRWPKSPPSLPHIEYEVDYEDQLVANVAYDLFTTSVLDINAEYEIMVWLAVLGGAGPISSTGKPIAHTTVGGVDFDMYYGMNGNMTVFSYVNTVNMTNSFSADLKQFFDEIPANYSIDPSQYLINVQAGTEPFSGTGTLTVSKFSAAVHTA